MAIQIRRFRDEDAPAVADLMREVEPGFLLTVERIQHWREVAPPGAEFHDWVAEEDGELAGYGNAFFEWWLEPGIGSVWLAVRAARRGRGIGAELYDLVERDLLERQAWKLKSYAVDDDGRRFAAKRGYEEKRRERLSQLDVRAADLSELPALEEARAAEGFRVAPLRELLDRAQALHAMFDEAAKDMPGDDRHRDVPYEQWRKDTLGDPLLELDGSLTVLDGDRPVAFAWIVADHEGRRAEHQLTGTVRGYRGRSLARLAKLAVVRWCRDHGIDTLTTGNDSANAPMLAINDRLGYVPTVFHTEVAKLVGARTR